ncbi:hypothetical protein Hanom_Chr15g01351191 [Helianthus anomalus]
MVDKFGFGIRTTGTHRNMQRIEMVGPRVCNGCMWSFLLVVVYIFIPSINQCFFEPCVKLLSPRLYRWGVAQHFQVVSGGTRTDNEHTFLFKGCQCFTHVVMVSGVFVCLDRQLADWNVGLWIHKH